MLTDPERALNEARAGIANGIGVYEKMLERWVHTDSAGAVAWAKRVDEEQRLTHIWSAYGQLRQFRSGVLKIAPPSETQRVFEELSRHDPRDAISRLKELGNLHLERDAVRGVARSWTNDDPTAAWEWANDLDVPELRRTASREVIAEVGKSSPKEAIKLLKEVRQTLADVPMLTELMVGWSKSEPDDAIDWILTQTFGETQHELTAAVFQNLEGIDAKVKLYDSQADVITNSVIPVDIAREWFAESPQAAEAWLRNLSGTVAIEATKVAVEEWAKQDAVSAMEYLNSITAPELRASAIEGILVATAEKDAREAFDWYEQLTSVEVTPVDQKLLDRLLLDWAVDDPEQALKWSYESHLPSHHLTSLAETWAVSNPTEAESWILMNRKAGVEGDQLVAGLVRGMSLNHPNRAAELAASISGSTIEGFQLRHASLRGIVMHHENGHEILANTVGIEPWEVEAFESFVVR